MVGSQIIDKVLEYTQLSPASFAKAIGIERPQAIYDIQKGKTKMISQNMGNKIISVFPEISKSWLLSGEGEMICDKSKKLLPPIEKERFIEIGAEVFEKKLNELFQSGIIVPASVVAEKDAKINELYREIGKLEAKIEELESKKDNAQMDENAECAVAK